MLERIISDCEQALKHNLYFAALNLALTLPDICAKAKYPNEKSNKKRYVDWYEENIGQYEKSPDETEDMPYESGEIIYSLRCSVLHQGNPNIDEKKCNITRFELIVEKHKTFGYTACDSFGVSYNSETLEDAYILQREIRLNLCVLCQKICNTAKKYYENNKYLFDFFNYHLIDFEEEIEQQTKIGNPPSYIECLNERSNND